jgi:hypothetical protein
MYVSICLIFSLSNHLPWLLWIMLLHYGRCLSYILIYIPLDTYLRGITGSYGSSVFSFLRNVYTDFYYGCTSLLHKQCPCQHLWPYGFLMTAILVGVRWNLNVVLICIFFMVKDVEHFFIYLLAICTCFENYLFNLLAYSLVGLFVLLLLFFF